MRGGQKPQVLASATESPNIGWIIGKQNKLTNVFCLKHRWSNYIHIDTHMRLKLGGFVFRWDDFLCLMVTYLVSMDLSSRFGCFCCESVRCKAKLQPTIVPSLNRRWLAVGNHWKTKLGKWGSLNRCQEWGLLKAGRHSHVSNTFTLVVILFPLIISVWMQSLMMLDSQ